MSLAQVPKTVWKEKLARRAWFVWALWASLLCCASAAAQDDDSVDQPEAFVQGYYVYSVEKDAATILLCKAAFGEVRLPGVIDGHPVTQIRENAFLTIPGPRRLVIPASITSLPGPLSIGLLELDVEEGHPTFRSVDGVLFNRDMTALIKFPHAKTGEYVIPAGVTLIEEGAFHGCHGLRDVVLPIGVTKIGASAFSRCDGLQKVDFPVGLKEICSAAFANCAGLQKVDIPAGVAKIDDEAFFACTGLKSLTIPASVNHVGQRLVAGCKAFTEFRVDAANPAYASVDGVLFNRDKTMLVGFPPGKAGDYAIPAGVIDTEAMDGPFGFGDDPPSDPFSGAAGLRRVTIPASFTAPGLSRFEGGRVLSEINVDASNPVYSSVDGVLFNRDKTVLIKCPQGKFGEYTLPEGVTRVERRAFLKCAALRSVVLPAGVTQIGDSAFSGCTGLQRVSLPASLRNFGDEFLAGCDLIKEIRVDAANPAYTSVDGVLFNHDKTELLCFPQGKSGDYAIPSGVVCSSYLGWTDGFKIEGNDLSDPFLGAKGLRRVSIPASFTASSLCRFKDCLELLEINVDDSNPLYSSVGGVLFNRDKTVLIKCPQGKTGEYSIPKGVAHVAPYAFSGCRLLTRVSIPAGVAQIDHEVFSGCAGLKAVDIPAGVTQIGNEAFSGCSGLQRVNIPTGVSQIGYSAFSGCAGLARVDIPTGVTDIRCAAFYGCGRLKWICLPASLSGIEGGAFAQSGVEKAYFRGDLPWLGSDAFPDYDRVTLFRTVAAKGWPSFDDKSPWLPTALWDGEALPDDAAE